MRESFAFAATIVPAQVAATESPPPDTLAQGADDTAKGGLEARGLTVSPYTRHEILESIYFLDPNGYPVEITLRLRDVEVIDEVDARLTLEAAMQLEDELRAKGDRLRDIDTVWRRKAKLVEELISER